jgi:hypothetical protein
MKVRRDFVTNSSSSSYLVWVEDVSFDDIRSDKKFSTYLRFIENDLFSDADDNESLLIQRFTYDMHLLKSGDEVYQDDEDDFSAYTLGKCFEKVIGINVGSEEGVIMNVNSEKGRAKILELAERINKEPK